MEDAHQIAELLKFLIPFIIIYLAYIHNKVLKNEKDIAVNNANDEARGDLMNELMTEFKEMRKDLHDLGLKIAALPQKK